MSETKRLIMVGLVIVAVVAVILLISFWPKADKSFACNVKADGDYEKLGKVNYKQYQCLMEEDSKVAIAVADNMTEKKKTSLNDTAKKIGHVIYYLDNDDIDTADMKVIKKDLKYQDNSFKKDVVLVIENGKVSSFKENDLTDAETLRSFLVEAKLAKFACDVTADQEYENLGELDYEAYNCLYESGEPFAVILAQTTCSYCVSYKPIIDEYVAENNLPIYIMEIDQLSDDERSSLLSSLSYFENNENWGTPLTLGIKNKEVVSEISGFTEDEEIINSFFDELGLK